MLLGTKNKRFLNLYVLYSPALLSVHKILGMRMYCNIYYIIMPLRSILLLRMYYFIYLAFCARQVRATILGTSGLSVVESLMLCVQQQLNAINSLYVLV